MKIDKQFCENLGKLFYAIALCDRHIEKAEYDTIRDIISSLPKILLNLGLYTNIDVEYHVSSTFNSHYLNNMDAQTSYEDFIIYKRKNEALFSKPLNKVILEIMNKVASSFSSKNKSELIMLANLNIELKK